LAEYRELPRISKAARVCDDAPSEYKLGAGHVKFFYDKGEYLRRRFEEEIVVELFARGFKLSYSKYRPHPTGLNNDWTPTEEAKQLNRERIALRLSQSLSHKGNKI
jgi:deoxyribonuclease (pyrimidine dimer)